MVDSLPSKTSAPGSRSRAPIRALLSPEAWLGLLAGLAIRLAFLPAAIGQSFRCDEPAYWRLGEVWAEHGVYIGPWPPLHPAFLGACQHLFGEGAEGAARVVLTLLSFWSGAWLTGLARLAHSRQASTVCAWLWAAYLPVIPSAHLLLSEGLFLALLFPALYCCLALAQRPGASAQGLGQLLLAGALLGAACLTRESGLFWLIALVSWACFAFRETRGFALHRPALLFLAALLTIAPWSLRASHKQGSFQLLGRTAGQNAYFAWNRGYKNFDLTRLSVPSEGLPGARLRSRLLQAPDDVEHWTYAYLPNLGERSRLHLHRGIAFLREHPGFALRRSVVKASDLAAPHSAMTRFLRMPPGDPKARGLEATGGYGSPIAGSFLRFPLALVAVLSSTMLAVLGAIGSFAGNLRRGMPTLILAGLASVSPLILFVASSRFRLPFEVLLLVPASAAIVDRRGILRRLRCSPLRSASLFLCLGTLGGLWFLSLPTVLAALQSLE